MVKWRQKFNTISVDIRSKSGEIWDTSLYRSNFRNMSKYGRKSVVIGDYNTDFQKLTGRLKFALGAEIG
jgi:hypothetical protein